jgi:hypothetical protein
MLIGWLFLMPVAGAAMGGASGALGGSLVDVGIDQEMKTQANEALKPGTADLFPLIRKMTTDKVLEDLMGVGGTVVRTSFDPCERKCAQRSFSGSVPDGSGEDRLTRCLLASLSARVIGTRAEARFCAPSATGRDQWRMRVRRLPAASPSPVSG